MSIQDEIKNLVENNKVVLFMKGNKKFPMCGFSSVVVNILDDLGTEYQDINVLESDELRQGIKDYTDWPTIPQLYINGQRQPKKDRRLMKCNPLVLSVSCHKKFSEEKTSSCYLLL